jgi:hypothetical protein
MPTNQLTPEQIKSVLSDEEQQLYHIATVSGAISTTVYLKAMDELVTARLALKACEELSEKRREKLELIFNSCPLPGENNFTRPYINFALKGYNALAALAKKGE